MLKYLSFILLLALSFPALGADQCCNTCNPCECSPCVCEEEINPQAPSEFPGSGVPEEHVDTENEQYFQGYLQALIDVNYYEFAVEVMVKNGVVYLYNLPKNGLLSESIVNYTRTVPGVKCLEIVQCPVPDNECEKEENPCRPKRTAGIWLPQQTVLFAPLLADPHQSMYSGAVRLNDKVIGNLVGAVSFGEVFPIYRWVGVGRWGGDLQVGIDGCVFAVFNMDQNPTELVNADYFVGIPFTYAVNKWSWRFRIWHESSHLGDEYIVEHPDVIRYNLSRETIDVFCSYQFNSAVRVYGGAGYIIHYDHDFPFKRPYIQYGSEFRFWGRQNTYKSLFRQAYFAVNIQNAAYVNWNFDATAALGIEWSKIQGVGQKMRMSVEGHDGYSVDGQFCKMRDHYVQFKIAYGY